MQKAFAEQSKESLQGYHSWNKGAPTAPSNALCMSQVPIALMPA